MARRSYHQHCSLARALDIVGERWTLLILRDLLCGARRYGQLLEGLPGIGTNLLAARLKSLLAEELIGKVDHDGTEAYALTNLGGELEPAVLALARFGTARLGTPGKDDLWRALWTPIAMKAAFQPTKAKGIKALYEFCIDDERFWVRVQGGKIKTGPGSANSPTFRLVTDGHAFLEFANGGCTPKAFLRKAGVELEGDLDALVQCVQLFGTRD